MRFVQPAVFLIYRSQPENDEIYRWLIHIGCSEEVAQKYAYRFGDKTPAERGVELAGRRCYMSFVPGLNPNVTQIREEIVQYLDNLLASKHGSVLAHFWFTFSIEGCSRVFTGEMNRHGIGSAISEGSMRFILYTDIPFCETPLLRLTEEEQKEIRALLHQSGYTHLAEELWERIELAFLDVFEALPSTIAVKKQATRSLFRMSTEQDERNYTRFQGIWADELKPESKFAGKKHVTSLGRRIIPMGVGTGGVWSYNIRSLRHVLTMRSDEPAEEEILSIAIIILERMMKEEPILFGDFKLNERGYWRPKYEKV